MGKLVNIYLFQDKASGLDAEKIKNIIIEGAKTKDADVFFVMDPENADIILVLPDSDEEVYGDISELSTNISSDLYTLLRKSGHDMDGPPAYFLYPNDEYESFDMDIQGHKRNFLQVYKTNSRNVEFYGHTDTIEAIINEVIISDRYNESHSEDEDKKDEEEDGFSFPNKDGKLYNEKNVKVGMRVKIGNYITDPRARDFDWQGGFVPDLLDYAGETGEVVEVSSVRLRVRFSSSKSYTWSWWAIAGIEESKKIQPPASNDEINWHLYPTGTPYSARIHGDPVEGKIYNSGGHIYLCQNKIQGAQAPDTLGYRFSWSIGNGTIEKIYNNSVTNLVLNPTTEEKPSYTKYKGPLDDYSKVSENPMTPKDPTPTVKPYLCVVRLIRK